MSGGEEQKFVVGKASLFEGQVQETACKGQTELLCE